MDEILYFGYGANSSPDMIEAIIGRRPSGSWAKLMDYELFIQDWQDIPEGNRKILQQNWGQDFKSYCIRPKEGKAVVGQIWIITKLERGLIKEWEFWYTPIMVKLEIENGKVVDAETEMIDNQKIGYSANGERYDAFLNDKELMLSVARSTRKII